LRGVEKIKIAIIHMGLFYNGGGERTVLNEAIGLRARGHEVVIFCPTVTSNCFPELVKKAVVKEICWWISQDTPGRDAIGMFLSSLMSPVLAKNFRKFDIILAHSQPSNWLAYQVKRKYGIPYVGYLHQTNRFLYPRKIDLITGWSSDLNMELLYQLHRMKSLIRRLDAISIKFADQVLVNSEWIRKKVNTCYNLDPEVCYPGVNVLPFQHQSNYDDVLKEPFLLSTNRHYPQKGLHLLIKCLKMLVVEYPSIMCFLTGSYTKYTRQLKEYVSKLSLSKNVIFTNNLKEYDLHNLYRQAYIYAYTSPEEDFGLGPIEAGACGVPSIVWDHAGPRETVVDGETGFRVPPYNIEGMVEKQRMLLDDVALRLRLGDQAHKFVKEHFSWEKHIDKIEMILTSTKE
jgi:alpha-1,3/alpha-1,6-mannosyltransferase